jgi:protocatechuate 3,4-dioxygenase beta subunit
MRAAVLACFVAVGIALATPPSGPAARCTPPANDGGGPNRSPPLRAKIGTGHVLTGVVLSPSCRPIPDATVSFWQSNAKGLYTTATQGAAITNRAGRFRFEGPRPTSYGGFPAHIHIKVEAPGFATLFTEYFPPRGSTHGSVRLVLAPTGL